MSNLYGTDWQILVCTGCDTPLGDNTMGAIHVACPKHPEPGNRKAAPGYRRVSVVPLTPEECRAIVVRIEGSQTVERLPNYKALLSSAREKLEDRP